MLTDADLILPDWPAPPGVCAWVTTRRGGESRAPYGTNNFALHVGDDPAVVLANRKRLCEHLGLTLSPQWLEQVHGTKVVTAQADGLVRTADACVTQTPGLACAVMTADCLPVLICDQAATQVAAVHAGWRGLAKGVVERTLRRFAAPPAELIVYLGPAISQPHFEVGIEVLEAFFSAARSPQHSDQVAAAFQPGRRPLHFHGDIYALARAELQALGVHSIYGGNACTYADPRRFYSFRRDGQTGRMASLIWLSGH